MNFRFVRQFLKKSDHVKLNVKDEKNIFFFDRIHHCVFHCISTFFTVFHSKKKKNKENVTSTYMISFVMI